MQKLAIAVSDNVSFKDFPKDRQVVRLSEAEMTETGVVLMSVEDAENGELDRVEGYGFGIPIFIFVERGRYVPDEWIGRCMGVVNDDPVEEPFFVRQLIDAASGYEEKILPPFFRSLRRYVGTANEQFDCPGHQGGAFFRRHPAGREFANFFGETIFRADLCNADVDMGDLLIHEGAAYAAEAHAAKVFNADKTYFVLNGTSTSNKVVLSALLTPGDLVLFDRNNHKSCHQGALVLAGARPVYLETARNPYGFIGGIDNHCFDEAELRKLAAEVDPKRAEAPRPFRCAVIQLGTYDGTIYNARQVLDRIGHLCDYILFDSAWEGYEQFIPMMKDCSPLLLDLKPEDPGIFVTQSVHKQQAGFSQTSQIHKKDAHVRGQARYVSHKQVNNAFMLHASTSPFYPLFASIDINAKMHSGVSGLRIWDECVKIGIEARKQIKRTCSYIQPFVPPLVAGRPWESYPTETIAKDQRFFQFKPGERWHAFEGYGANQYFVDPCKFLLTTPGIDTETGEYEDFGVPATILANYLRAHGVVPEKCDLNSILFLLTPSQTTAKISSLTTQIARFEKLLEADALMKDVIPQVYSAHENRYEGYRIREICQEMHDYCREYNIKDLQKAMFRRAHFPKIALDAQTAHFEFMRGNAEYVPLEEAEGRIALEGALPYPPGVICCVPGEVWGGPVLEYFLALAEGINRFPGFSPELQGVYLEEDSTGRSHVWVNVLKESRRKELEAEGKIAPLG